MAEIIPVIHNVSSVQRLVDSVRVAYSLGARTVVASKVYGGAAQSGVPEAMRIALKLDRSLLVLSDLRDASELLSPDHVYLVTRDYAEMEIDPSTPSLEAKNRVLIVFSGADPEFSPAELKLGTPIYFRGVKQRLGPVGEAALLLYYLLGDRG